MRNPAGIDNAIVAALWARETRGMSRWRVWLTRLLRGTYVLARDLLEGQLTLRAMSLVFTTLLSLVPLLALSFSVLKAFGVHNQLEPLLLNFLGPLGDKGVEITTRIIGFVENVRVGVLGSLGLGMLLYTVISLVHKIEQSFNYAWQVRQPRPFAQRFSGYLSVLLIGPVLVFSAMGITATLMSSAVVQQLLAIEPFGTLIGVLSRWVPYLLVILAFTLVYIFVPNTSVRPGSAFAGALAAGTLWQTTGWGFAAFVVASTKYTAIYSSFAILIMFMLWLYLSWLILLLGASIAFYHQHPEALTPHAGAQRLSPRLKEKLALLAMFYIGRAYRRGDPAWTAEALTRALLLPVEPTASVLEQLVQARLLLRSDGEPPAYVPARALESIAVQEILAAIRCTHETTSLHPDRLPTEPAVERVTAEAERSLGQALAGATLLHLVASEPEAAHPEAAGQPIPHPGSAV